MRAIADSGFIVAHWSKTPARRQWAQTWWTTAELPLLTSAANLQEAGWLLENHEIILRMVKDGDLFVALDVQQEAVPLHALVAKYQPRADLADAAIIRLSELYPRAKVLTVDREDFQIYCRFGHKPIPCNFGPEL